MARRTAAINQLRGFLLERGVTFPVGRRALIERFPAVLSDPAVELSPRFCQLLLQLREEWRLLDEAIHATDHELARRAQEDEACRRLTEVPGIGPLTATAFVAAVGHGAAFAKGRDLAAWLGLVPRQHSTGGKTTLRGISKRGNAYLRYLFIPRSARGLPPSSPAAAPLGPLDRQPRGQSPSGRGVGRPRQ